jgi:integrase
MARPRSSKPTYCHDRTRGRAYCTIDGQKIDLGPFDTPASRDKFDRLVGEWIGQGRPRGLPTNVQPDALTVSQLIAGFWAQAQLDYPTDPVPRGKRPGGELGNYWDALRPLRRLYGSTPAAAFGPRALVAVREAMIQPRTVTDPETGKTRVLRGWCRRVVNRHVDRLKKVFRWAVASELLPGEVAHRLSAVDGLRRGRTTARESEGVKPVPEAYVNAVLPLLSPAVRAMVRLQLLSGMRPGELVAMRSIDVDTSGTVWVYRREKHKTAHHGKTREVRLGPRAREVLAPFLRTDLATAVFSPAESAGWWDAERRANRKTPMTPSHAARRPVANRRRPPGTYYTVTSYRRAIERACAKADRAAHKADPTIPADLVVVPRWHPNQLRHARATSVRAKFGAEAARLVLGHSKLSTTEIYAEADAATLDRIVGEVG